MSRCWPGAGDRRADRRGVLQRARRRERPADQAGVPGHRRRRGGRDQRLQHADQQRQGRRHRRPDASRSRPSRPTRSPIRPRCRCSARPTPPRASRRSATTSRASRRPWRVVAPNAVQGGAGDQPEDQESRRAVRAERRLQQIRDRHLPAGGEGPQARPGHGADVPDHRHRLHHAGHQRPERQARSGDHLRAWPPTAATWSSSCASWATRA